MTSVHKKLLLTFYLGIFHCLHADQALAICKCKFRGGGKISVTNNVLCRTFVDDIVKELVRLYSLTELIT